ncbi:hypothetical protein AB6A40_005651 [Gnathostoma spinigerum]|uniref:Formin-binding protein 1-like n=1 Tax=Gnathostoma spinigerum TaxID=75299 RepID=A0ABD6EI96_9BILA
MTASSANWCDLWDQVDALSYHTQKGIEYLEKYGNFLKERASIEDEYAAKLRALAKKNFGKKKEDDDSIKAFTYFSSFLALLREMENVAGQHEMIAEGLRKEIQPDLMTKCASLRSNRKDYLSDIHNANSDLNTSVESMFKSYKNYGKAFKEAEAAHLKYDKAEKNMDLSRADLEKAKNNASVRTQLCEEAKQNYAHALQALNERQHKHYTEVIPKLLEKLRAVDEERIECTRRFMERSIDTETKVMSIMQRCYDDMRSSVSQISPAKDSATVVEQLRSGYARPQPFPFEDFGSPSAIVTNEGTSASDSPASATLKRGVLSGSGMRNGTARSIPRKASMHQKLFGGGSSNHHHKESNSDYHCYPPQQKCRHLQKKIQECEKDIATKEQSRDGLIKMLHVYKDNPNLGNAADVDRQIGVYKMELENLNQKLAKYKNLLIEAQSELNVPPPSARSADPPQRPPPPPQSALSSPSQSQTSPRQCVTPLSATTQRTSYSDESASSDGSAALSNRQKSPNRSIKESGNTTITAPLVEKSEVYEECQMPALGVCTAVYSFEGGSEGTIPMTEGDEMLLIEKDEGDGWTRVDWTSRFRTAQTRSVCPTQLEVCRDTVLLPRLSSVGFEDI